VFLKLTIAYEGTAYAGWQTQKVGLGVQQVIEEALEKIFGIPLRLHSSSRTDTGVHARGMVAHLEVPDERWKMTIRKFPLAVNAMLPEDIRVMAAVRAPDGFHARFAALSKEYRYYVWNHFAMDPLRRQVAWLVPSSLDLAAMKQAAAVCQGTHDFAAFAGRRDYEMKTTVRTLHQFSFTKSGPLITFRLVGDGFLYKMCRGLVGTVIQVGQGKVAAEQMIEIISSRDRTLAGMTAPAHGLVLWRVNYR